METNLYYSESSCIDRTLRNSVSLLMPLAVIYI